MIPGFTVNLAMTMIAFLPMFIKRLVYNDKRAINRRDSPDCERDGSALTFSHALPGPIRGNETTSKAGCYFFPNRFSVPFNRRTIFPRWRQIAKAAIKTEKPISNQKSVPVFATIKSTAIGRATAAMIEANEVYRLVTNTAIQTTPPDTKTRGGNRARTAPPEVAIPLPPLKRAKWYSYGPGWRRSQR